ncbi:MAG TPA: nucleotidyltransferase domain-containing protein [Tepidisphaeraceae bacterium]|nr:nucleotidyltransferase domain-containing protein [Tepidisphaeraceae bacterium]
MAEQLSIPLSLNDLRDAVRPICETRPIARVEVFGSIANGTADADSDIDLLVEFLPTANFGLFEMGELKEELEQRLGRSVDLLSRHGVEQSRNPIRRRAILANPITIYAR